MKGILCQAQREKTTMAPISTITKYKPIKERLAQEGCSLVLIIRRAEDQLYLTFWKT
ncbi:hypothetical protein J6590_066645 [Homalodisca vitripennis]|nr:hypothetical protein J6590_066645 [Homalodisca vitripennis]